jgi:hypothetical protein
VTGFIAPYTFAHRDYKQRSAIAILQTFQFTFAYALGFSAFTRHILATDISQSHCHLNSHMKSFWHSLIHFLPFFLNQFRLPSTELDSVPLITLLYSVISSQSQSQSYFTTGSLPPISSSWRQPLETQDENVFFN